MVRTLMLRTICAVLVGFVAFLAADTADAGCGWLHHGRAHGASAWAGSYSSWGAGCGDCAYGYDDYGYGGIGYGSVGYSGIGYGSVGYHRPRYYTRWDYPYNWGWSGGLSGHHIWGHWYQDGGIWGVTPVSAAIQAYGPSRYYSIPSYQGSPYGTPGYGAGAIYHGAEAKQPAAGFSVVPSPAEVQVASTDDTRIALLTVAVPEEARVFVNGRQTTSRGAIRKFESAGLQPGRGYAYEVRAEVERNGQWVSDVQKVDLRAGEARNLVFNFETSEVPETSLTLRVPEDAKVELAGAPTTTTGTVRTFATTGLGAGQGVPNYTVRVAVERFGRVLVKEQTIHLQAGQNTSLAFDFDENQLANSGQ